MVKLELLTILASLTAVVVATPPPCEPVPLPIPIPIPPPPPPHPHPHPPPIHTKPVLFCQILNELADDLRGSVTIRHSNHLITTYLSAYRRWALQQLPFQFSYLYQQLIVSDYLNFLLLSSGFNHNHIRGGYCGNLIGLSSTSIGRVIKSILHKNVQLPDRALNSRGHIRVSALELIDDLLGGALDQLEAFMHCHNPEQVLDLLFNVFVSDVRSLLIRVFYDIEWLKSLNDAIGVCGKLNCRRIIVWSIKFFSYNMMTTAGRTTLKTKCTPHLIWINKI